MSRFPVSTTACHVSGPFSRLIRHIFGCGGDSPNVIAAVGRLVVSAARGTAPPPEPGLLETLCRDRERRASVSIDQVSLVASPNGFLTAARAATALKLVAVEVAESVPPARSRDDTPSTTAGKQQAIVAAASIPSAPLLLRPSVSTSVHVQVGKLHSLLSLDSRPLASLSLTGLAFEASRSKWWDLQDISADTFRDSGTDWAFRSDQTRAGANKSVEKTTADTGWSGWTRTGGRHRTAIGSLRVGVQGLDVLDLTADGQLHNQVISHEGAPDVVSASPAATTHAAPHGAPQADRRPSASSSSRAPETATRGAGAAAVGESMAEGLPVIMVELIPENSSTGGGMEINVSVHGLRICFLRRFMAEVIKYFGPDGLGPVFTVMRRLGAGGRGAGDGAGNDSESVPVANGEEDNAAPDKWSVCDSDDEREEGSRQDQGSEGASSRGAKARAGRRRQAPGSHRTRAGGGDEAEAGAGMRVTAVLQDLIVVLPRNTHSIEAAAVKCEELVLEVSCWMRPFANLRFDRAPGSLLFPCGKSGPCASIHGASVRKLRRCRTDNVLRV